jgi:hypothetical protein
MDIGNAGRIAAFSALPTTDYLIGRQDTWDRHILLVKDPDPLGPNYFVIRDTTTGGGTAEWRLWVNARQDGELPAVPAAGILQAPIARDNLPAAVRIEGETLRFTGEHDVDLDVWLAATDRRPVDACRFELGSVLTVGGFLAGGWSGWDDDRLNQVGVALPHPRGTPLLAVLYPRLRDEPAPALVALADGRAAKVSGPWGEDYVFLATEPFEFAEGPVRFKGTVGAIQRRDRHVALTLAAAGEIGYADTRLAEPRAATRNFPLQGSQPTH